MLDTPYHIFYPTLDKQTKYYLIIIKYLKNSLSFPLFCFRNIFFFQYTLKYYTCITLCLKNSRFLSVVAHPDLDWKFSDSSLGHVTDFKIVLTIPQPGLVIMSLSKARLIPYIYNIPPDKDNIIQRAGFRIRQKG